MSCVLRAYGARFLIDRFLKTSRLRPCEVWHKGESRLGGVRGKPREHSGMNVDVSEAGWDQLDEQIADALRFLEKYGPDIRRLGSSRSVDFIFLDFGVRRREADLMQGAYLPSALVRRAGEMRVGIKVTAYAIQEHGRAGRSIKARTKGR